MIGAGEVFVHEVVADKSGLQFPEDCVLRVKKKCPYVSRGGLKLEKALSHFNISLAGKTCVDIGASSGGFTDCLLQHNAQKVYAIDVAYGQLDWKIRQDERVVVLERFNARKIEPSHIDAPIDLAVMDVSFISITKIIPPLLPLFSEYTAIIALIKPQFELPKEKVGSGGIVRDAIYHQEAIDKIDLFAKQNDLKNAGVISSPIFGPKGNKEFLIYLTQL